MHLLVQSIIIAINSSVYVYVTVTLYSSVFVLVSKWSDNSAKEVTCVWHRLTRRFGAVHLLVLLSRLVYRCRVKHLRLHRLAVATAEHW